jgi:hypothetical protein
MTLALGQTVSSHAPASLSRLDWPFLCLCWLALSAGWIAIGWHDLMTNTGSTDDTMRLLQVRNLINGVGFYNLFEPRLAPVQGLEGHWSRLVDLPIAGLILLARPFLGPTGAEIFAQAVWPALTFGGTMLGFVIAGRKLAPDAGPLVFIAAFIATLPISVFFRPNMLDHHNAQMMLAVGQLAAALWIADSRKAAFIGGLLSSLTLMIGYESLHVWGTVQILVVLAGLFGQPETRLNAQRWLSWHGLSLLLLFAALVPLHRWQLTACDAIGLNMLVFVMVGTASAVLSLRLALERPVWIGLALLGGAGAFALTLGFFMDPACLAGPNAKVDPRAISLWMRHVAEVEPYLSFLAADPAAGLFMGMVPAFGLAGLVLMFGKRRVDLPVLAIAVGSFIAIGVMLTQLRGITYANLLSALLLATAAGRLIGNGRTAILSRFIAVAALPIAMTIAAGTVIDRPTSEVAAANANADKNTTAGPSLSSEDACAARGLFDALSAQPRGLVLGHIDVGPALLLHTPHDVVMAPYHRADLGIVAGMTWMNTPLGEAHAVLKAAHVAYLVDCTLMSFPIEDTTQPVLRNAMIGKSKVDWLEAIAAPAGSALHIWRVLP